MANSLDSPLVNDFEDYPIKTNGNDLKKEENNNPEEVKYDQRSDYQPDFEYLRKLIAEDVNDKSFGWSSAVKGFSNIIIK